MCMRITFDPAKNEKNIAERGLSFELAEELEWDTALAIEDKDSPARSGVLQDRLHAAVVTTRDEDLRAISFRKANRKEEILYEQTPKRKIPNALTTQNPEWTREDVAKARPAAEDRKVNQTLRIDPDVLEAYRQWGRGWQTHINEVLRKNMPKHQE